ncbi:uncharacterized protein TNCV_3515761 [Trichonephila clavipes]|nr:uncharacterized protein TNCV_3515761 [Trichonephila clavipes]
MSGNTCGCRILWTYRWAVMVPRINTRVQFPLARHHSKRRRRWVGVKASTRNGRSDHKYPSVRRLRMVREDTRAPSEGATCAWMVADKTIWLYVCISYDVAVFLTTGLEKAFLAWSSCKGHLSDPRVLTPPHNTIEVAVLTNYSPR